MPVDTTPWAVNGGAEHFADVARLMAYASTAGAEGVVEPSSLRVAAQSVANGTVRVLPGAALILNRYSGAGQQTYVLRNPSSTDVAIPATGSSGGRTDLIVARILDPQYEGQPPANPLTFQYSRLERINGVPAGTKSAKQLNLGYPAIALAKVTLPASTGTVTAGMITDLREVALPRRKRDLRTVAIVSAGTEELSASGVDGEYWPNAGGVQFVEIPEWATRCRIIGTWAQVRVPANSNPSGQLWLEYGPYQGGSKNERSTQSVAFNALAGNDVQRTTFMIADDVYIPAAYRGTTQPFVLKGKNGSASPAGKRVQVDGSSAVYMDLEFLEAPAEDV